MDNKRISAPKVVADPIYGIIDVRPVLPMMETQEFQALGDKRQLGMSYLTFPSATHTRKAHSLGAYHATREIANRWVGLGFITKEEADALAGYALYHDIGHPAFSHVVEDLCDSDNDELGIAIVKKLRGAVEASGINYGLLESMARHENPLYLAVHDKNLGTEKLDYLERDGLATILSRPAGVDYLREHIYFVDGEIAIDEKVVDNAVEVQNFYLKMYKNVYLRKSSAIAQRMFQKMVYYLLRAGEVRKEDLPHLTDSELLGTMRFSGDPSVRELYDMLKRRDLFREAIAVRPEKFAGAGSAAEKAVAVFGLKDAEIARLMNSPVLDQKNQEGLEGLEKKIAAAADLPEIAVIIVPVFNPGRFKAKDIYIHKGGRLESLKERHPAHFKNMEEVAQSYIALRISAPEKYRKKLAEQETSKRVLDLILKSAVN